MFRKLVDESSSVTTALKIVNNFVVRHTPKRLVKIAFFPHFSMVFPYYFFDSVRNTRLAV